MDHKIKHVCLLIINFFFCLFIQGNSTNILSYNFNWNNSVQQKLIGENKFYKYIGFDGAILNEDQLPEMRESIKINRKIESVKIINPLYDTFPSELLPYIEIKNIDNDIKFKYYTSCAANKVFLNIQILPIKINELDGTIERLLSCDIEIVYSNGKVLKKALTERYSTNSMLKTGQWFKFKIIKTGLYSLTYDEIENLGLSNPANIGIYGLDGGMLPDINDGNTPNDLIEIPVRFFNGSDGIFNKGDFIVVYLKGPNSWTFNSEKNIFEHEQHQYSYFSCYFITDLKKGKEVISQDNATGSVTHIVNSYNDYIYHELDTINPIQSGREWYGEKFYLSDLSQSFEFNFPNLKTSEPVKICSNILSRSESSSSFIFRVNSSYLGTYSIPAVNITDYTKLHAEQKIVEDSFTINNNNIDIEVEYDSYNSNSIGYLDYVRLNVIQNLVMNGNQMAFRDISSVGEENISRFVIQNVPSNIYVWDVTDFYNVKEIQGNLNGNSYEFIVKTDTLKEFVTFVPQGLYKPIIDENKPIENQDLHGLSAPDYLIITHSDFENYANELADFHRENSNLNVHVVNQEQIFNEFSSGTRDVCAIRNFVKMFYDRTGGTKPRYLLLFGDGSFDNKHFDDNNYNFILTYQSLNSLSPTVSYVSDDFFGLLDDNEDIINGSLDIGIGRFPVSDTIQAKTLVNKVKTYMNSQTYGDWRNTICFIGDDEDSNLHMSQADKLSDSVQKNFPWFNRNKIFLDAYKQVSTAVGARYPDVNNAIYNQLEKGALIINYTGHGAEWGLAHERILSDDDINDWNNWGKFPVFMTATCEFSRFDYVKTDDYGQYTTTTTTGENVVLHDKGGAVASLTTTRLVYAPPNFQLNQNFYKHVFQKDEETNERLRLGDIIRLSKNDTQSGINKRNFSLLGDPALILTYPKHRIKIDSINGTDISAYSDCDSVNSLFNQVYTLYTQAKSLCIYADSLCTYADSLCDDVDSLCAHADSLLAYADSIYTYINIDSICEPVDTLGALSFVTISGHVEKQEGGHFDEFNGELTATIYDKPENITTLDNDNKGNPFHFKLQNNIIFKGKATVTDGNFKFSFLVPKDISYLKDKGKISCYAHNGETDASGCDSSIIIGGFNLDNNITDNLGPDIEMFMNDIYYKENGITNESPTLLAYLEDESGINTTTSGIGHEMVAIIDDNFLSPIIMNDFYESEADNYKKGKITYPLLNLEPGEHTIWIKVWDVLNNSNEGELKFVVKESNKLVLQNVYNYPNPVKTETSFVIEHNQPDEMLIVTVKIFTLSGQLVKMLKNEGEFNGYMSPVITWNGKGDNGNMIDDGLYFYTVKVESEKGTAVKSSKILIIR